MKDRGWLRLHKWRITAAFLLALSELSTAGAQEGDIAEALRLTGQVVQYYATGRYQEAIPLAQRALAITEKARGPEHPDTAVSLNNLAMLYQAISAYAEAAPLYEQALAIIEKALGPEHPNTAIALNNLAALYVTTAAYEKAEPLYRRALAIHREDARPRASRHRHCAQQSRLSIPYDRRLREGGAALPARARHQ